MVKEKKFVISVRVRALLFCARALLVDLFDVFI